MIVTPEMVREWGGTCGGVAWFEKQYPKGVEITAENVRRCPSTYYNKLWLLKQVAARAKDASAQVAVDMLVELAEPQDAGWLANVVCGCSNLDTDAALARVLAEGDRESLMQVVEKAPVKDAELAARELVKESNPATLAYIESAWPQDRRALVDDAKRKTEREVSRGL